MAYYKVMRIETYFTHADSPDDAIDKVKKIYNLPYEKGVIEVEEVKDDEE
jgi:hypothetical protein